MKNLKTIINLIRIRQWYKNIIIFLPLVFAFQLFDGDKFFITLVGFFALSLVSSAMYVRNDLKDLEEDLQHPTKKQRPLPAGLISKQKAKLIFLIFAGTGLVIGVLLNELFLLMLILLMINTEIYSRWTKHVIFLDAFAIGINFIIRAISGIFLLEVPMSPWIILGVFFVALFLAFIKRKGELESLKEKALNHRKILEDYSVFSLSSATIISAVMVIVTYSLYAMNGPNGDWRLILTVPFVIFVILRQIHLSSIKDEKAQSNEIFKDKPSAYAIVGYAVFTIILIYWAPAEFFAMDF